MSEERKALFKRLVDEGNKGNYDAVYEHYSPDFVLHQPPFPDIKGLEVLKRFNANMRASFPDLYQTIDEIIIEGDIGAARFTLQGTHTGQSKAFPFPPTGKKVTWSGCVVSRMVGEKVVEAWGYWDNLGMMQQFGIIPSM
jgi:predicted ester cyclase